MVVLLQIGLFTSGCATIGAKHAAKEDPKTRIQALENELRGKDAQLAAMQAELMRTPRDSSYEIPSYSDFEKPLGKDEGSILGPSVNVSVKSVQRALKGAGFYSGAIDGRAGTKTKEAVRAFQKSRGLKTDGVVGKNTWAALSRFNS
jgi:murein L,D-transpeptidase YcbB/YkuD